MSRAASAFAVCFGGSAGAAVFVSDHILYPSWMHRGSGEFGPVSERRAGRFFDNKHTDPLADWGKEYHTVHFGDEEEDRGWYIPASSSVNHPDRPDMCVVAVHGAGNDRREMLKLVGSLQHEAQCNMLMFDCSNHGMHPGSGGISMGAREHLDVMEAVRYARAAGNTKICIFGTSQGAASAVVAAAKLQGDVDGLILENPFSCAKQVLHESLYKAFGKSSSREKGEVSGEVQRSLHNPIVAVLHATREYVPTTYIDFVKEVALYRMGVTDEHQPLAHMPHIRVPVMFLHGTEDDLVSIEHTERLREAAEEQGLRVESWHPPARHSMLFNKFPEEFTHRVSQFVRSV